MAGPQTLAGRIQNIAGTDLAADPQIPRTAMATETKPFHIGLETFRVWNAMHTNLPGTAAADDLALLTGTLGTDVLNIQTSDAKATTVTQKAGFSRALPAEYVSGGTITIRFNAGMLTTDTDGTATIDLVVYKCTYGLGSSDICATSAISIAGDTLASNCDFTITPSGLVAGDQLMGVVTIAITDAATGTAVIGKIGQCQLMCQIKG